MISREGRRGSVAGVNQSPRDIHNAKISRSDNEKKRGYETALRTKTVSSKNKAYGQKEKAKN